jgi:hypothetical protein
MSCIRCDICERIVDTDYDVEGIWDEEAPYGLTCGACCDREGLYDDE